MAVNFWNIRNGVNVGQLPSAPANPKDGDIYYDTGLNLFQKYENGSWSGFAGDISATAPLVDTAGVLSLSYSGALSVSAGNLVVLYDGTTIGLNGSNQLYIPNGGISNAQINASAAIAYSKLNLSSSIVNSDISSSAAIAFSKLASLPSAEILVGNGSNVATAVSVSGDLSLSNTGAFTIGAGAVTASKLGTVTDGVTLDQSGAGSTLEVKSGGISNTQINSSAAIAYSKLASLGGSTNDVLIQSSSGYVQASGILSTDLFLADGSVSATGAFNLNSNKITNLANGTASGDAVNYGQLEAAINGLTWKGPVQAYASSNQALTGSTPLVIDGYTVNNGDELILANQTTASQNYVYSVAISGGSYTLTEVSGYEAPTAIGDAYLIENGTQYGNSAFQVNAISPNVTFIQFAGPNSYSFNYPLSLSGTTVSLNYAGAIQLNGSNQIYAAYDNSTIDLNGSNQLEVKAGGISNSQVNASAAIAYSKLNLSGSIVNSDINSSAAIAYSKLNLTGDIVNSDINASAAIAYSKLNLSNSVQASDMNSGAATSSQPLFANGSGGASYRSIVSGDLPSLAYANQTLSNLTSPTSINQSLLFASDNTYNIGAVGANRPANVYVANYLQVGGSLATSNSPGSIQALYEGSGSSNANSIRSCYFDSSGGGKGSTIAVEYSPGTMASPTPVQSGNTIGIFSWKGVRANGGAPANCASIQAVAQQTFTSSAAGTSIQFLVTANNTTTQVQTVSMDQSGSMTMQAASGANLLWNTDAAGNIGASVANRPANAYVQSDVHVGQDLYRGDKSSSSAVVVEHYVDSITLTDNQSSATNVDSSMTFSPASYSGFEISYVIESGAAAPDTRIGTCRVACKSDGSALSITDQYGETVDLGVTLSVVYDSSNVSVQYTSTSQGSNRTMRADIKKFRR
jgi:hypothetical protein